MSGKRTGIPAKSKAQPRPAASAPMPSKTPLYSASNAARYGRQTMIKTIEKETGRTLLCYVAVEEISRDDTMFFMDMLHNVKSGSSVDLLLHTPGGDVDAAEKLIQLLRARVTSKGLLKVIIPDYAKSAGTLIALGANAIVMSDTSELGTIDPQYVVKDSHGYEVHHSVLDYILSYEDFAKQLNDNPGDPAIKTMFEKFDPTRLHKYRAVRDRARTFGENQLKRSGANFTKIVSDLMDTKRYPSHGQMIGWEDARQMGLPIEYLSIDNPLWQKYWDLFCQYRLLNAQSPKIFESVYASHT